MSEKINGTVPELGDPVRFRPSGFEGEGNDPISLGWLLVPKVVTGKIVYINQDHRFYDVEYEVHGVKLREAFKF